MRRTLRWTFAFVIIVLMFSQVAFAANCEFTFTANGKTYRAIHNTAEGYYKCLNPEPATNPFSVTGFSYTDPNDDYVAYDEAFDAAKDRHQATCSNYDLGDESIPMMFLYGGVVLAAISAIIVHQKRTSIQEEV